MSKAHAFQLAGAVIIPLLLGACGSSSKVVATNCDCGATAAAVGDTPAISKNLGTTLPPLHCAP